MPKGDRWSEERIAGLKELHAAGYSASIIAEKLGITRNAVIGKVHRLDLPPSLMPKTTLSFNSNTKAAVPRIRQSRAKAKPAFESVRAVRANGNSDAMRLMRVIAAAPFDARSVDVVPLHVSLIDLDRTDCRYPYGGYDEPITFCGHLVKEGSSYCTAHHDLCWEKPRIPIRRFAGVPA